MKNLLNDLSFVFTVLWVGSLWSMLMVTSILFDKISSTYIAGAIASDMFQFLNYFGIFVLSSIIFIGYNNNGVGLLRKSFFWIAFFTFLLVLIRLFGINPFLETLKLEILSKEVMESMFTNNFRIWHGIASIAHLLQSILGITLVLKMRKI